MKSSIDELLLDAIKDLQLVSREHTKAIAELDKTLALVNLKIAIASAVIGAAFALAQHLLIPGG